MVEMTPEREKELREGVGIWAEGGTVIALEALDAIANARAEIERYRRFLPHLVDVVWGDAMEDGQVPCSIHAQTLITRALESHHAPPEVRALKIPCTHWWHTSESMLPCCPACKEG